MSFSEAELIIDELNRHGYKAYIVGGAVRDLLMNKKPSDTDIATNALPEEIKQVFKERKIIETGIKHGTVTLLTDTEAIEITTFRIEDGYSDGRHPDKVSFTSDITKDLARRDFTMNSIAFNKQEGFIDPFNGAEDIKSGIIRCVGIPEKRFREDSLRILRALRFASVSGFEIEKETEDAMFRCKNLLSSISMERIYSETVKLLCGHNVKSVIMKYAEIIAVFIPEVSDMIGFNQHNYHHKYDLLEHTATVTAAIAPIPHLRIAAFLHDVAKPGCMSIDENGVGHFYGHPSAGKDMADKILSTLKCDNVTKEKVTTLIKLHDTPIEESERIIKRKLRSIGSDLLFDLISLQEADTKGLADEYHSRSEHFSALRVLTQKIIHDEQCFSLKDLAVNGHDLIEIGYSGKEIGEQLNMLLDSVIDGKAENTKKALMTISKNKKIM